MGGQSKSAHRQIVHNVAQLLVFQKNTEEKKLLVTTLL